MGLLGSLGKVVGLDNLVDEIGETVRQVLPNEQARREFDLKLEEIKDRHQSRIHEEILGQLEINKEEAKHSSMFVAGWRPAIGWVCASGLLWNFVVAPGLSMFGVQTSILNIEYLVGLVTAMLGTSGLRTFEKLKGVSSDTLKDSPAASRNIAPLAAKHAKKVPTDDEDAPWNR